MKIEELTENIGKIDDSVYTYTPKENDELITEVYVGNSDEPLAVIDEQQMSSIKFNTGGLPTELRPHLLDLFSLIAQYGNTPLDKRFGKKYRIRLIPSVDSGRGGLYLNITNDQGNFDVVSEVHAEAYDEIELIKFAKIGNLDLSKNLVELSDPKAFSDDINSDGTNLDNAESSNSELDVPEQDVYELEDDNKSDDSGQDDQSRDDVSESTSSINHQPEPVDQNETSDLDDYQDQSEPVVSFEETKSVDHDSELNSDEPEYAEVDLGGPEETHPSLPRDEDETERPVKRVDPGQVATTVADKIAKRSGLFKK